MDGLLTAFTVFSAKKSRRKKLAQKLFFTTMPVANAAQSQAIATVVAHQDVVDTERSEVKAAREAISYVETKIEKGTEELTQAEINTRPMFKEITERSPDVLAFANRTALTTITERDALVTERANLTNERDALVTERANLTNERDALVTERDNLTNERDALVTENDTLIAQIPEFVGILRSNGQTVDPLWFQNVTEVDRLFPHIPPAASPTE